MTLDIRPVAYVVGLLVLCLGAMMVFPLAADLYYGNGHWGVFLESMLITMLVGGLAAIAASGSTSGGLELRQIFLLTTIIWVILPLFGALPFMLGAPHLNFTDAFFEAMSGLTTTGATVISGLGELPEGILLWRGILQWLGGVGIVVVAMVFLPELKVGGMQIFKSESFDTMGKILPRAAEMSSRISVVYISLTLACVIGYSASGMAGFDALVHGLTTVSTGGMANDDASFGAFGASAQYVACIFMVLAALPFVRYVQMMGGSFGPFMRDSQIRLFALLLLIFVGFIVVYVMATQQIGFEAAFRVVLFNIISIMTGTGYASADYTLWGPFVIMLFFFIGLIGGCAGSTSCSVKLFRYQLLFSAIGQQIRNLHSPHGVFIQKYEGRAVEREVLNSVMAFFLTFPLALGVVSVGLSLTGLDFVTSVSGAAAALANIGPGLGNIIGPAGNYAPLNDTAKWICSAAMIVGRLEILTVLTLFSVAFWRS